MRTTITLDSDVEALLKKVMRERGLSFKEAVNSGLRAGLGPSVPRADYVFATFDLGVPAVDALHALRLASDLEDEEIAREMSVGR
ncbi:MAG: antitoxin [Dermatophilaceae bacterium]